MKKRKINIFEQVPLEIKIYILAFLKLADQLNYALTNKTEFKLCTTNSNIYLGSICREKYVHTFIKKNMLNIIIKQPGIDRCSVCDILKSSGVITCDSCKKKICSNCYKVCNLCLLCFCNKCMYNCQKCFSLKQFLTCLKCKEFCFHCKITLECECKFYIVDNHKMCHSCSKTYMKKCFKCNRSTYIKNITKCSICNKEYCYREYCAPSPCDSCNTIICNDHIKKCNYDESYDCCDLCVQKCGICKEECCKDHIYKCYNCDIMLCDQHKKTCDESDCDKNFCEKCLIGCSMCKSRYCKHHNLYCEECKVSICEDCNDDNDYKDRLKVVECCNKMLCDECIVECSVCDNLSCRKCSSKCYSCGKYFCSTNFIDYYEVNLSEVCLPKCQDCNQYYCHDCNEITEIDYGFICEGCNKLRKLNI